MVYAKDAGFRREELELLKELNTSAEIFSKLNNYISNATIETSINIVVHDVQPIKDRYLSTISKPQDGYFQNPLHTELSEAIYQLKSVKIVSQIKTGLLRLQSSSQEVLEEKRSTKLLNKIFIRHKDNFEIWSSKDYIKKIPARKKSGHSYINFITCLSESSEIIAKLNDAAEEQKLNLPGLLPQLKKLNMNCSEMHKNLRFLAAGVYPFGENDFDFLKRDKRKLLKMMSTFATVIVDDNIKATDSMLSDVATPVIAMDHDHQKASRSLSRST